jgi:LmbE family N-acetylglucosaminyl deacetylase
MGSRYDVIYLSPHLDDAILSCGGQIYQRSLAGGAVLIVTIAAGDAPTGNLTEFAQQLHQRWQLEEGIVHARRLEDAAAGAAVGADIDHWDVLDCVYRRHPQTNEALYPSQESIFGPLHPAERALIDELAGRLLGLPKWDQLIIPLAIGQHVDHQLTKAAAERAFGRPIVTYYEDYPYVQWESAPMAGLAGDPLWKQEIVPLAPEAIMVKIKAISCYQSQVNTFFASEEDLAGQVGGYIARLGGERLWHYRRAGVA